MLKQSSGISVSSSMSSSYLKDPSTLVPTLAASGQEDGVDAVVRFYANGTDEVKNLLKNECSIIYECRSFTNPNCIWTHLISHEYSVFADHCFARSSILRHTKEPFAVHYNQLSEQNSCNCSKNNKVEFYKCIWKGNNQMRNYR